MRIMNNQGNRAKKGISKQTVRPLSTQYRSQTFPETAQPLCTLNEQIVLVCVRRGEIKQDDEKKH